MVKPDATSEEIRAARIACAHEFIMALPMDITLLLEKGELAYLADKGSVWHWLELFYKTQGC